MRSGKFLLGVIALAGLFGCSGDDTPAVIGRTLTFYRPSTVLDDGTPGDVIQRGPIQLDPSVAGTGERITFVSTTPAGDLVPVTGVAIRPLTPAPAGGYPVVVWGHGTVGLGDPCAPSRHEPFNEPGLSHYLARGYVVVAPDYEGLGIENETHPYLVGEALGYNLLDAARVGTAYGGGSKYVIVGASQGGHSALFARQLAEEYLPDLTLLGVVASAPVTDPATFLAPGRTDPDIFPFTAEAILAWSEVYEEPDLTDLVVVEDAENVRLAREELCTEAMTPPRPLDEIFLEDPQQLDLWTTAIELNTPSAANVGVPVFLIHGDADELVPISGTLELHDALCDAGEVVSMLRVPDWMHGQAILASVPDVVEWVEGRFAGTPAPDDC